MAAASERGRVEQEVAALFDRVYVPLVRSLRAAGHPDADDAVQEAFVQATLHWTRVRGYDDPAAWVRRVAVHRCLNAHRSRRRQAAVAGRVAAQRVEPARAAEREDDDVRGAVAALPPQQRTAVALFYLGDLPAAAVAAAMGISEGAVRYHLHEARARLRAALREHR